jgi:hypothetical protein
MLPIAPLFYGEIIVPRSATRPSPLRVQESPLIPRGPVPVIVPDVLSQDSPEMPLAEDQHVVQALAAQRAHEPLRVGVRSRRPDASPAITTPQVTASLHDFAVSLMGAARSWHVRRAVAQPGACSTARYVQAPISCRESPNRYRSSL